MSLLADMLSKAGRNKNEANKSVDIPPSLKRTVSDYSQKETIRRKVITVSGLAVLFIAFGIAGIYLTNIYLAKQQVSKKNAGETIAFGTKQAEPVIEQKQETDTKAAVSITEPRQVINQQAKGKTKVEKPKVSEAKSKEKTSTVKAEPLPTVEAALTETNSIKASETSKKEGPDTIISAEKTIPAATAVSPDVSAVSDGTEKKDIANKDFYLHMAKTAENKRDYQEALAHYKSILDIEPKNHVVMNNISNILINMGSFNEAIKYAEKALGVRKNHVPSLINLAVAHMKLKNYIKGKEYLLAALSAEPFNKIAIFNTALLYENIGDYDNAGEQFRILYNMGDIQGYLGLGRTAERQGRVSDAIRVYKEVISINDVDPKIKMLANERVRLLEGAQ